MRGAWVAGALAAVASFADASAASATIAIRCGSLIDGKGDAVRKNVTIVIEGERIAAIRDGAAVDQADTAQVIDLSSETCLPGSSTRTPTSCCRATSPPTTTTSSC